MNTAFREPVYKKEIGINFLIAKLRNQREQHFVSVYEEMDLNNFIKKE